MCVILILPTDEPAHCGRAGISPTLVDYESYFLTVSPYIELNPVRARMVALAGDYPWSSYRANAMGKDIKLLSPHPMYLALGEAQGQRLVRYRALFQQEIDASLVVDIRHCTNKSWVLGSAKFKAQIENVADRRIESSGWGGMKKGVRC